MTAAQRPFGRVSLRVSTGFLRVRSNRPHTGSAAAPADDTMTGK
jgi:hypothetical protein